MKHPKRLIVPLLFLLLFLLSSCSFVTYHRYADENTAAKLETKRKEAIDALSSVLWGYTSKDSLAILEQFFPKK